VGHGEWLVIEADESDGSIVEYHPEVGMLLNIDKDHKEVDALMEVFTIFKNNSHRFIVNQSHNLAATLSTSRNHDFSTDPSISAGYVATGFEQNGLLVRFRINGEPFQLHTVGRINMENALAAVTVAHQLGVSLETAAAVLLSYKGIYRRHQVLGKKDGVLLIDDYAHNPVKCAGSIEACQPLAPKLIAWFQPHGYGPTKFLRHDFVEEIARVLRPSDEIWMSEIFYAGGTAVKDISAADLINDLQAKGCKAFFVENRNELVAAVKDHLTDNCVLLLMGARDPGLEQFASDVWHSL
jgi:UDP-N-acetylmuramate--alanine ligase